MNRYLVPFLSGVLLISSLVVAEELEPYEKIKIKEIFSKLIVRDEGDRIYSGQIKSEVGVAEFEKTYGIKFDIQNLDFKKQMLIFGITDSISTRAFQLLKQDKVMSFTLDYMDTGIEYKIIIPGEGEKHSFIQIFIMDRIDGIAHLKVKNLINNGLSRIYGNNEQL